MANETNTNSRRPRRWLRWLGYSVGGLLLILVLAYFVGTSGWALKSVILPKVSSAMNAKVTVEDASLSPFSAVTLRGLKVETTGTEPLVSAKEVRLRYSLMDIIKGNVNVAEITLESPVVSLVTQADGSSNLDPITKQAQAPKPAEPAQPKGEAKPVQLNLAKFVLKNATIRKIDHRADGTKQVLELVAVNVTAEDIGNNKVGQLALAANIRLDQGLSGASNGVIGMVVGGNFNLQLDAALQPQTVKGLTKVDITEAKGAFAQAAGMGLVLNADLTPAQLNDVSLRVAQNGNNLAALTVSGPFNAGTQEGKLLVALSGVDRRVLNMAGGPLGIDFNQTAIGSTNTIELSQKGRVITVNGAVAVANLSLTQQGQTTPALDVRTGYAVTYDQTNQTALVQAFTLNGTQNTVEFLRGALARPMLLEMGKASGGVDESAFNLVITNFNLADWRVFAGTNATLTSGRLDVDLGLVSQQAGKRLALQLTTRLRELTASSGANRIENADLGFSTRGTVQDFSAVNLETWRVDFARAGQVALTAGGALQYNTLSQDADVQVTLETILPQVAALVSVPGLNVSAGSLKFAGRITQKNTTPQLTNNPALDRAVLGKLNLDNFTGSLVSNRFDRFVAALDVDILTRGDVAEIRKLSGALRQSEQPGGGFEVTGNFNTVKKSGEINAQLIDLNQHALKSFLAAALGDKQLESVTINSKTAAKLGGPTDMAVETEWHVANLVVNDPSGRVPRTPLAVDFSADVAQVNQVVDLKSVQLALTKTERAPNSLNVGGRIDMTKSNAWTGAVKVSSEGLDLTPYYDLFAGDKPAAPSDKPAALPPIQPAPGPEVEPPAMQLPFAQFVAELNIAKLFLREIAISNWVTKATIQDNRVTVNPFALSLNGAPVSLTALANVGVPGYEYDLNARLDRVPVEPIVNTFQPDKRGQVKGELLTLAAIKGAGITGPGLKKNLGGSVVLTLTNANVQISQNKYVQMLLQPLALALQVPELANSPLNWLDARVGIGGGTVTLTNAIAESSLFRAGLSSGTMTLKDVLTNSTFNNLPVSIELRRSVAGWAKNLPGATSSTNFVALPYFYSIGGTLGEPKPRVDTKAVASLLLQGALQNVGGDAGKVLKGLGLGGGPSTNAASTNAVGNLIQGLGALLDKSAKTNASGTNAPAKGKSGGFKLNDLLK